MKYTYISKEKIGNVNLYTMDSETGEEYSDGDVENELLELFKSKDSDQKIQKILSGKSSWAERYHLLPARGNVVAWHNFKPGSRVLEVGSGCGSITEELIKKDISLDSLEISKRRSLINAHRNKVAKNLNILVGNLQDYEPTEKYDYVVCIGVLEYAGTFIDHDDPYAHFVNLLKKQLKPGGTLLLAIENRLGLKYWSGSREDHTGGLFDSLNNYPGPKRVQTFGKEELGKLLETSFKHTSFVYPFPDYKLPQIVFSDSYKPGKNCDFPLNMLPTPAPDQERYQFFSEALAMRSLTSNNLYDQFSNSFVVAASDRPLDNQPVFSTFQSYRLPKFRLKTQLIEDGGKLIARKTASQVSEKHLKEMTGTYTKLKDSPLDTNLKIAAPSISRDGSSIDFEYISGRGAERELLEALLSGNKDKAIDIVEGFLKVVESLSTNYSNPSTKTSYVSVFGDSYNESYECTNTGIIDLNLDNIIIDSDNKWHLIDYEWFFDFPIPKDYIVGRFVFWFFVKRYRDVLGQMSEKLGLISPNEYLFLPDYLEKLLSKYTKKSSLMKVARTEAAFQKYLTGRDLDPKTLLYPWKSSINDIDEMLAYTRDLLANNSSLQGNINELLSELHQIKNSKTYRLALKMSKAKGKLIRKQS